ncbi:MAG TPA: DUF4340 domain-containing protein [Bacteroidales bacterium]|nr:DUF4340 domain-containing protein [Bacteroidales bacterium]HPI86747.1 DUF4340 domain-containing protein [Bacteroidales bacterium]HPM92839.1 DUF4340 domain-containing protein [Bacteroidales bacterium]
MKKNRIILIITLILIIIAAILVFSTSTSTLNRRVSDFSVQDTASVTKIFMADKSNNELLLERQPDGSWIVDGKFQVQQAKISAFLKTLKDLTVRSPVPLAARDNVIKRMAVLAKKVEIYQVKPAISLFNRVNLFPREKLTKVYYVGDVTQDNQGTYMLMEGADDPFIVHITGFRGFVSSRYSTIRADWRDFTVFKTPINRIRSVRVEYPQKPEQSFEVDVLDNQNVSLVSLADNRNVAYDTLRTLHFLTSFEDVRFESLLAHLIEKEFIDSVSASTPKTIISLTDTDGRVNRIKIFNKKSFAPYYSEDGAMLEPVDLDRAYALVNEEEDFVLIQYFVFDKVTRTLDFLTGK